MEEELWGAALKPLDRFFNKWVRQMGSAMANPKGNCLADHSEMTILKGNASVKVELCITPECELVVGVSGLAKDELFGFRLALVNSISNRMMAPCSSEWNGCMKVKNGEPNLECNGVGGYTVRSRWGYPDNQRTSFVATFQRSQTFCENCNKIKNLIYFHRKQPPSVMHPTTATNSPMHANAIAMSEVVSLVLRA